MSEPDAMVETKAEEVEPKPRPRKPAPAVADEEVPGAIESILLTSQRAVAAHRIAAALGLVFEGEESVSAKAMALIRGAIDALNGQYESTGRAFRIEEVSGGYRLVTLPKHASVLAVFHQREAAGKLSKAAIETLAVIAFRQPITRGELESIRGVACGEVLRSLMDRRLVTIKGRAEEVGRPILYGTTKQFLDMFGLASLKDLPQPGELKPNT